MEKLELRHIAPYLPYGLKLNTSFGVEVPKGGYIYTMNGVSYEYDKFCSEKGLMFTVEEKQGKTNSHHYFEFKPVLRSLSDLTKEIEHNGERFVPLEKLRTERWGESLVWMGESPILESYNTFDGLIIETDDYSIDIEIDEVCFIKNRLHEWHFDTEGLIEKGLAIDYNKVN